MQALNRANAVRLKRSAIKRGLKRGEHKLADVLDVPELANMLLYDLLTWLPVYRSSTSANPTGGAHVTAEKLLAACQCSHSTVVGSILPRRRVLLLEAVQERFGGRV